MNIFGAESLLIAAIGHAVMRSAALKSKMAPWHPETTWGFLLLAPKLSRSSYSDLVRHIHERSSDQPTPWEEVITRHHGRSVRSENANFVDRGPRHSVIVEREFR